MIGSDQTIKLANKLKKKIKLKIKLPGNESGGSIIRRIYDVIGNPLVEITKDLNQWASHVRWVCGRKWLLQRHHIIWIRHSFILIIIICSITAVAAAIHKADGSGSPAESQLILVIVTAPIPIRTWWFWNKQISSRRSSSCVGYPCHVTGFAASVPSLVPLQLF